MKHISRPLFSIVLIILMIVGLLGCGKQNPAPAPTEATPTPTAAQTPAPQAPAEGDGVPELEIGMDIVAGLNSMQPVYDAVMRALRDRPAGMPIFDPMEPDFFWSTLYYLSVNHGDGDSRNTIEGAELYVPFSVMEEYAAACFFDFVALIPLPEDDSMPITIDEAKGAYCLPLSDAGEDFVSPSKYAASGSEQYDVTVAWLSPDMDNLGYPDMLGAYVFTVSPNPYNQRKGLSGAEFSYSVKFAFADHTDIMLVKDVYERNGKQYALLDPVVINLNSPFDLDEDGQPYGFEWEEIINEQDENIEFLISQYAEFSFGQMQFVFEDLVMEDALEDSMSFFLENAKRKTAEGEHLAFRVNVYDNVLYLAEFAEELYFVG